jgi:hypothetical protein
MSYDPRPKPLRIELALDGVGLAPDAALRSSVAWIAHLFFATQSCQADGVSTLSGGPNTVPPVKVCQGLKTAAGLSGSSSEPSFLTSGFGSRSG